MTVAKEPHTKYTFKNTILKKELQIRLFLIVLDDSPQFQSSDDPSYPPTEEAAEPAGGAFSSSSREPPEPQQPPPPSSMPLPRVDDRHNAQSAEAAWLENATPVTQMLLGGSMNAIGGRMGDGDLGGMNPEQGGVMQKDMLNAMMQLLQQQQAQNQVCLPLPLFPSPP